MLAQKFLSLTMPSPMGLWRESGRGNLGRDDPCYYASIAGVLAMRRWELRHSLDGESQQDLKVRG
jgi:hypothetical protein